MSDMALRRIVTALRRFTYRFTDEKALHDGIAVVLDEIQIPYQREFVASANDRFDFLCEPGIVIEAKIHGSISSAVKQCSRYAEHDNVEAVVLATSRFWGKLPMAREDAMLNGKPWRLVQLRGQSF